jgi:hypothetical protein
VDRVLFLGLMRMEGLHGIGNIVAHHACAVGGVLPVLRLHGAHGAAIPFARGRRRAAPIAVTNVQHVVAEILEDLVWRFRALEIGVAMLEKEVAPTDCII